MIRVLVVEDSATAGELLMGILAADPELRVVGWAKDGIEAVEMTRQLRPDVVTMDVHMPRLDGFEATKRIMSEAPTPIVIVSASVDVRGVAASMDALEAGALTLLEKPAAPQAADFEETSREFRRTVKAMSQVKVVRRWLGRSRVPPAARAPGPGPRPRVVAVTASTGGPAALHRVLSGLPPDFPAPIVVVQHIARGFVGGLATWLDGGAPLRVKVAEDREPLLPATAYLASDDCHLGVSAQGAVTLSAAPAVGGFRPSGTFLFESVASAFGPATVALVLTGMGQDGVEGLRMIRKAGGRVFVQDEASSVVFGMGGAAVSEGLADAAWPLDEIASRLVALTGHEKRRRHDTPAARRGQPDPG